MMRKADDTIARLGRYNYTMTRYRYVCGISQTANSSFQLYIFPQLLRYCRCANPSIAAAERAIILVTFIRTQSQKEICSILPPKQSPKQRAVR